MSPQHVANIDLRRAVFGILLRAGREMSVAEIVAALAEQGVTTSPTAGPYSGQSRQRPAPLKGPRRPGPQGRPWVVRVRTQLDQPRHPLAVPALA